MVEMIGLEPTTTYMRSKCSPFELHPHFGGDNRTRTDDLMLAKHALSQLSYTPLVDPAGFEPATPRLSSVCSNQLSYKSFDDLASVTVPIGS